VRVGAAEEGREVVVGGEVTVVDEVLAGVLGVVGPRLRRQPPHQAQHLAVRAQPRVRHRRTPPGARGELLLLIAASLQWGRVGWPAYSTPFRGPAHLATA